MQLMALPTDQKKSTLKASLTARTKIFKRYLKKMRISGGYVKLARLGRSYRIVQCFRTIESNGNHLFWGSCLVCRDSYKRKSTFLFGLLFYW
jgi:hypothetical protein